MPIYDLPYGENKLSIKLEGDIDVVTPNETPRAKLPLKEVENALDLSDFSQFSRAQSVAIAINDKTRPVPNNYLLPPLVQRLRDFGIPSEKTLFLIATGTHLPMSPEEHHLILPAEIIGKYPVISHNCDEDENLTYLGDTSRGTPIYINRLFHQADLKIVVGNLEPHHFMGFSGGAKSVAIGLTGRKTINANHAMLIDPMARVAEYDRNPMRQDVEEIGQRVGTQLALNTVLNQDKEIVHVLAGNPSWVMKAGIPLARKIYQVNINHLYDLSIASVGGYPKDINLYQSQKALTHACLVTREGGTVILVAECREGSGSKSFEDFMQNISTVEDALYKFKQQEFRVGPHKAFQIAQQVARVKVILVSRMPAELVRKFWMVPANSLQEAWQIALPSLPRFPKIAILPRATNTIPSMI